MRSQLFRVTVALAVLAGPAMGTAAPICPAEVKEARELLAAKAAAPPVETPVGRSTTSAAGATMRFDRISEVDDPRSAERALWEGVR
jgi:hypothetical protein